MRDLAALANTSASTINKLEKGETKLNTVWMERLSKALEVPMEQLISGSHGREFKEDAELYKGSSEDNTDFVLGEHEFLYKVKTNVLDQIGIITGTVLRASVSQQDLTSLRSGDVVLANAYDDGGATTVIRQFIEPSLLITNSSSENQPILNLRTDDIGIKAVVISSHIPLRRPVQRR